MATKRKLSLSPQSKLLLTFVGAGVALGLYGSAVSGGIKSKLEPVPKPKELVAYERQYQHALKRLEKAGITFTTIREPRSTRFSDVPPKQIGIHIEGKTTTNIVTTYDAFGNLTTIPETVPLYKQLGELLGAESGDYPSRISEDLTRELQGLVRSYDKIAPAKRAYEAKQKSAFWKNVGKETKRQGPRDAALGAIGGAAAYGLYRRRTRQKKPIPRSRAK